MTILKIVKIRSDGVFTQGHKKNKYINFGIRIKVGCEMVPQISA